MAGGNKKKKKPAANPARGFATTSIQSKSKTEHADGDSADPSGTATPDVIQPPVNLTEGKPAISDLPAQRELHELSPEEFEAQLETSELQQIVEKHATKVRKEASRQVSRLQTDKRLLRGHADFLSVKDWLPEELMQQIIEFTLTDLHEENPSGKKRNVSIGDDLVAKVWNLRTVLIDLDVSFERVNEVVGFVLQHPPLEDPQGQIWGLTDALDWIALHCEPGELLEYDVARGKKATEFEDETFDATNDQNEESGSEAHGEHNAPYAKIERNSRSIPEDDSMDVSDVESDLEPDELLSTYLRTKTRLYGINPDTDRTQSKKTNNKNAKSREQDHQTTTYGERKLQEKLQKIERDVLFDSREADAQWAETKIELARDAAERRKLELADQAKPGTRTESASRHIPNTSPLEHVAEDSETFEQHLMDEKEGSDDGDMLGGMFSALPVVPDQATNGSHVQDSAYIVTTRDFGRLAGITPRRVLEETCHSRDSRCRITYRQVSPTTYACRHSVSINWTKEQQVFDSSYLSSVSVESKPRYLRVTMMRDATPDVSQSEAYIATATLFIVFSHSPKEEKSHMRLPPSFRNLWDEFSLLKHDHVDAVDRETVRELRTLIEKNTGLEDAEEDEVVFNASRRHLNGTASGILTPISRPQTPRSGIAESSQTLRDIWTRKATSPSYQRMLFARMNLPMFQSRATAVETIDRNQITIVVGDTGSGKSTQVPQFILEHELSQGRQCKIYCTEPRRISAVSLAQRVSEELGEHKGDLGTLRSLVGYAIRLESHTNSQTRLVYATVGIVLRMLENADGLSEVTHLVLDEVHERSIDTDFLLIVIQTLVTKRPDLKVVLMSATVDAQKFSQYLGGVPIITVPGRTFPVQPRFLEDAIEFTGHVVSEESDISRVEEDEETNSDRQKQSDSSQRLENYSKRTINTLAKYDEYRIDHVLIVKLLEKVSQDPDYQRFSRAVLIFMPGIAEIRQLHDILLGHPSFAQGWRIHALHSSFSSDDQQAAFDIPPEGIRKIVIATNIAETGITIPDVTCVIDTGKHREMRFDERRQISKLTQSFISRANAKQRRGRAGRVQEGICFHLFTKYRFEELMAEQQTPEMLRLSLQDLIMRVKICKLGDIETALAQALDPPSSKNVRRAIDALIEVGALNEKEQLTSLGNQLAKLPLDAQLGKLILFGAVFGCLDFALTVAATLTSKSPFLSPLHAKKQADSVRLGWKRGDSDLLTLYNAYSAWRKVCTTSGVSEYHFCNKNFLSPQNLANIEDLKGQLLTALADANFVNLGSDDRSALARVKPGSRKRNFITLPEKYCKADNDDLVASSVVAWSLYPKILKQEGKGWRNIANNQSIGLHPTSVNKAGISSDVKYLSFYSIMQSSSRFTNAQETTVASDFALVLLAGDAVFHMYAGVIVVDGNRLKFKVRDWRTMIVLKMLRTNFKEALGRSFKYPGRELGDRQRRWMEVVEKIFEQRRQ